MNARDVLKEHERAVVLVHYRRADKVDADVYQGCPPPQNPACYLQITLDAANLSPSGKYICLGQHIGGHSGDHITGWTHLDALEVVEILGELAEDGKTVRPILASTLLEMKHAMD